MKFDILIEQMKIITFYSCENFDYLHRKGAIQKKMGFMENTILKISRSISAESQISTTWMSTLIYQSQKLIL